MHEEKQLFSFSRSMIFQCFLMFAGICAGLWINEYFLVAVATVTVFTAIFTNIKNVYYQLLFCLPFTMIYKLSPTSTSLFAYVMLVVGLVVLFKIRNFGTLQFLLIMMFAIYVFIGMGDNVTTVIKMVVGLILFYAFTKKIKSNDFKNQIMSFTLGMVTSSCIGLLKGSWYRLDVYFTDMDFVVIDGSNVLRFSGLYPDPNYFSVSVIIALTLCMILFFNRCGNRGLLGLMMVMLALFGFMSYSKIFLVSIILVALVYILKVLEPRRKKVISVVFILVGAGALYKWMEAGNYLSIMMDRIFGGDISTGRFDIWGNYLTYIWNSPKTLLFGDGLGASYRVIGGPHNTYIESIFFIGLVGTVLLFITLFTIFKGRVLVNRKSSVNYILSIVFVVMIATLGCLTVNDLMFYFMLLWISLNFKPGSNREY